MFVDKLWMWKKYKEFSQTMFDGKMPALTEITFDTTKKTELWGYAYHKYDLSHIEADGYPRRFDFTILMSNAYDSPEYVKETTMIHEMIHIYDYYNHPEHYIQHTWQGWRLRKGYDAHGDWFMSYASKIKDKFGYDIQKYVTEEEQAASTLRDEIVARRERKEQKGYIIGYQKFGPNQRVYYQCRQVEGMMFKCATVNVLKKIMSHYDSNAITAYLTHDPKFKHYAGCADWVRGWYMSPKEWDELVADLSDKTLVTSTEQHALAESFVYSFVKNLFAKLRDGGSFEGEQLDKDTILIAVI